MKKIMFVLAAIVVAGMVQAASVSWQLTNVRIPVATDVKIDQSGIVTTSDSAKFAAGALTIQLFYQSGSEWKSITSAATTSEGTKAKADFWTQAQATDAIDETGSSTIYFKIMAEYATADGTYTYTGTTSKDIKNVTSSAQNVSMNMNSIGSWDYVAKPSDPTPEPTSGLLLLVGGAMLALRRKQK